MAGDGDDGSGKVSQADGRGRTLATVDVPATPYGIAVCKDGLVAALPRAGTVVSRHPGKGSKAIRRRTAEVAHQRRRRAGVRRRFGGRQHLGHSLLLPAANGGKPLVVQQIHGAEAQMQNMSVAMTKGGFGDLGTDVPVGIYRFLPKDGVSMGEPVLPGDGGVAADPASERWVACQPDGLHCFEKDRDSFTIPFPAGKGIIAAE